MNCNQIWRPGGLASFGGSATHTDMGAPSSFICKMLGHEHDSDVGAVVGREGEVGT